MRQLNYPHCIRFVRERKENTFWSFRCHLNNINKILIHCSNLFLFYSNKGQRCRRWAIARKLCKKSETEKKGYYASYRSRNFIKIMANSVINSPKNGRLYEKIAKEWGIFVENCNKTADFVKILAKNDI